MQPNPENILRDAIALLPSAPARDAVRLALSPIGAEYRPKGGLLIRASLSHDATGTVRPYGSPWKLFTAYRASDGAPVEAVAHGWNDAPDAETVSQIIREVL